MNSFEEPEPSFDQYDELPEEDPFDDVFDGDAIADARYGEQDWEGFQVESELEFKDGVTERLLETVEEYLGFATKTELLALISSNF